MFVLSPAQKRVAGLVSTSSERIRHSVQPRFADRRRARFRVEGLEERRLLSITEFPLPSHGGATLLGQWNFDGSGNDTSGNGYNLNLNGGVGFGAGHVGAALELNHNESEYASRPSSDTTFDFGSSDFTISIWVNFNNTSNEQTLIEKWDAASGLGWTLTKLPSNAIRLATSFATGGFLDSAPLSITTGAWHNIVARREGANWILDYDGQVVATVTNSSAIAPASNPLEVGRRDPGGGQNFPVDGLIDEAAIWNGASRTAKSASCGPA